MTACANCGRANDEDARFCAQCGASLVPACPQCGTERPEGARFCPSCGARLTEEPAPAGQERRLVTVLFADVVGSTGLGERLDPESLREVMDAYFDSMREEIEAEGGTVEKFIGDAVMAVFGVPVAHEDDPRRALRAASRMHERMVELNQRLGARSVALDIRIGVNTGEVLAATAPRHGEAMATGDAVNVAARLQQGAAAGQTVVSDRTARAARGFRFEELGELDLRGKSEPIRAVVLVGETAAPERGVPGLRAPMVGRDRELALLQSLFERVAAEGRAHLLTIYGDPGVGKSRLTAEFEAWAEGERPAPTMVRGRCLPYGDGITYWPLAEILKARSGARDTDHPGMVTERIRAMGRELLTEAFASDPERATAALAYTVGVEEPGSALATMEPRQVRQEIHSAWRSFFSALAGPAPVIAVMEDIHWADPALLDLLEELADRVEGPVLFVCPARPELTDRRPDWGGGRRNVSSISLDPLSTQEADRLVSLLLSVEDLPQAVHARILERAEGNPFFLEEIVRHMIDEGFIRRTGDRWRAGSDIGDVTIPDTVQGVLAARIDLLDAAEKRALQRAAVVGRVFWPGPVMRLLNGDAGRLQETLSRLEHRELVLSRLGSTVAGEPEFAFKHVLTRDVAYESLPRRERGGAHAVVAEWIEETAGEQRRDFLELLAYHYEAAHLLEREEALADPETAQRLRDKAFRKLLAASEDARRRFAVHKAAKLAERALALAEAPVERAVALEQIGMVALNDYRGDLAWASFAEAADLRARHAPEDRTAIARVCARAAEIPLRWPGSMRDVPAEEQVRPYVELGFAHVGQGDSEEHVRLLTARAFGPFSFGVRRAMAPEEFEAALAAGERAADMAMRLGRPELASAALDGASSANLTQGLYGSDVPIEERRLQLAEMLEDPWEVGDIFAMGAWLWAFLGDYPKALATAEEGAARGARGALGTTLHCLAWAALAEFSMGHWTRVTDELFPRAQSFLGDRRDDPPYFVVHLYGAAAFIHEARQEPAAQPLLALIERLGRDRGGDPGPGSVQAWLSWILARRGEHDRALATLEEARRLPSDVARPLLDQLQAELLAGAGRWADAAAFLPEARAYAERAGLEALPVHLDRLEGRMALATDGPDGAVELLTAAGDGFAKLRATWERARTDAELAEALMATGRTEEARARLERALSTFEELGSVSEIGSTRAFLAQLV